MVGSNRRPKFQTPNRQRIIDCAEELFSVSGIDGVSVREITTKAVVDVSQVNYYFGTKESLFEEVLIRRVGKMSEARRAKLAGLNLHEKKEVLTPKILTNFAMPLFGGSLLERHQLSNYRKLIALVANSKRWQDVVFKNHYDAVAESYIDALCEVNDHLSRDDVCWLFNFFLGSLTNAIAETGRVDRLSHGSVASNNLDLMIDRLIKFSSAGFLGMSASADEGYSILEVAK